MLRDAIRGLDKVFKTDVPPGKLILVTGSPGTLKSAFVYTVLSKYLTKTGESGIYVTLEESREGLLRNIKSLGIPRCKNLHVYDYNRVREIFKYKADTVDYLRLVEEVVPLFKNMKQIDPVCFALDSLNALYSLIDTENLRQKMYYFFKGLRDKALTAFIIMETPKVPIAEHTASFEFFLADGLIELGMIEGVQEATRYLRVEKMRETNHSTKKFGLEITEKGLLVLGPIEA